MELKPCHRRPLRPDEIGPRVMELSKYLRFYIRMVSC